MPWSTSHFSNFLMSTEIWNHIRNTYSIVFQYLRFLLVSLGYHVVSADWIKTFILCPFKLCRMTTWGRFMDNRFIWITIFFILVVLSYFINNIISSLNLLHSWLVFSIFGSKSSFTISILAHGPNSVFCIHKHQMIFAPINWLNSSQDF